VLQEDFVELADVRSRINVSGLLEPFVLQAIMDISARAISLPGRLQWAIWVTSVRTHPGRPILHRRLILSQITAGKGVGYVIDSLLASCLSAEARGFRQDLRI
jgi:hypothetical protein